MDRLPALFNEIESYADPHLLCFSKQEGKTRQSIAKQIQQFYRFRWLDNNLLGLASSDNLQLVQALNKVLDEESQWAHLVQPKSVSSPLLLPECCFVAGVKVRGMWEFAIKYGDIGNIKSAAALIEKFADIHWKRSLEKGHYAARYKWVDTESIAFDTEGERHAQASPPRSRKYSYLITPGFHFDVKHESDAAFTVCDFENQNRKCPKNKYVNIDPHGVVTHGEVARS